MLFSGGLFTQDEHEQELVFRFAVDRINQDSSILSGSKLIAEVERINDKSDTFHADKKGNNYYWITFTSCQFNSIHQIPFISWSNQNKLLFYWWSNIAMIHDSFQCYQFYFKLKKIDFLLQKDKTP